MVEVKWTKQSISDLDSIAEFIAKDSVKYAEIQIERFLNLVEILSVQPKIGRIVHETDDTNIRELIQGNYRIIYRISNPKLIDILTVHHSRRLLSNNPAFGELIPD